jgi:enolase-phosphatase E1
MIKAILTDVEGTTTSLSFVKDVLFPYSRAHLPEFVQEHAVEPPVREQLDEIGRLTNARLTDDEAIAQLLRWIDEDQKIGPLKTLQGMIWDAGYRGGDFTGHVYDDAARKLKEWKDAGLRLYVFSSGSVRAQKLIFGFSDAGDLTPLFSGYFDTAVGNKREAQSYGRIATEIGLPADEILFLSDIREELDAARASGMRTTQLVRDGMLDPDAAHPQVRDFHAIAV